MSRLGRGARLLLWDYGRGTLAYDVLWLALVAMLALVPVAWWGDPLTGAR